MERSRRNTFRHSWIQVLRVVTEILCSALLWTNFTLQQVLVLWWSRWALAAPDIFFFFLPAKLQNEIWCRLGYMAIHNNHGDFGCLPLEWGVACLGGGGGSAVMRPHRLKGEVWLPERNLSEVTKAGVCGLRYFYSYAQTQEACFQIPKMTLRKMCWMSI